MSWFSLTIGEVYRSMICNIDGPLGYRLRHAFWKRRMGSLGRKVKIGCNVSVVNPASVHIGDFTWIDHNVTLIAGDPGERQYHVHTHVDGVDTGVLRIGSHVHLAPGVIVQAHGGFVMGSHGGLAAGVKVYSLSNHYRHKDYPPEHVIDFSPLSDPTYQSYIMAPVRIGDHCGVGLNSILMPGAHMEDRSWLGIGSVLYGTVEPDRIAAGNPAGEVKTIR